MPRCSYPKHPSERFTEQRLLTNCLTMLSTQSKESDGLLNTSMIVCKRQSGNNTILFRTHRSATKRLTDHRTIHAPKWNVVWKGSVVYTRLYSCFRVVRVRHQKGSVVYTSLYTCSKLVRVHVSDILFK